MSRTLEGKAVAWLTPYSHPRVLQDKNAVAQIVYSDDATDMTTQGWTRIGEASIRIALVPDEKIVADKVEALRKQQRDVMSDAIAKSTRIDGAIQSLLAIGMDAIVEAGQVAATDDIPF